MKKQFKLMLAIAAILVFLISFACSASAAEIVASGSCGDSATYELDDEGTFTVSGTGEMTGYSSWSKMPWSSYIKDIKKLVIEEGITYVGSYTFYGASKITSVELPSTLTSIGSSAFAYALGEIDVTLPDSVTRINKSAFANSNLTGINLPENLTDMGQYAFSYCKNLNNVVLPDSLTSLPSYAFRGCTGLTNFTFNNTLVSMGEDVFDDSLVGCDIVLPKTMTEVRSHSLRGCAMNSITLHEGITSLGSECFRNCSNLTSVVLSENITIIPHSGFSGCKSLKSISMPGVTKIEAQAFGGTGFEELVIPEQITSIGSNAFSSSSIKTLVYSANCNIPDYAFQYCKSLTEVVINEGVKSIGNSAFYGCTELKKVTLPESGIGTINSQTFNGCSTLESITIPSTVLSIESDAFPSALEALTVYGYDGSYAETFAAEKGYTFVSLGEMAEGESFSGSTSTAGVTWHITNFGNMYFKGAGDVKINVYYDAPWRSYSSYVKKVIFTDTITGVYDIKLDTLENLESVSYHYNVGYIASESFSDLTEGQFVEGYSNSIAQYMAGKNSVSFTSLGEAPIGVIRTGTMSTSDITWSVKNNGTLILSGSGATPTVSSASSAPWYYYNDYITKVEICDGITKVGNIYLSSLKNLKEIEIAHSVGYIYNYLKGLTSGVKVKGYTYSIAEFAANEAGLEFVSLGEMPVATVASGSCGDNATYKIDSSGTLTISGTGKTKSYSGTTDTPWSYYYKYVKKLVVDKGINLMNYWQGPSHKNIRAIELHYSVLGGYSFSGFAEGTTITGYTGSYAQRLAEELDLEFISLGIMPDEAILSGTIDNISWSLNGYGKLTLSGEGAVKEYSASSYPWYSYQTMITELYIEDGITVVPSKVLGYYDNYAVSKVTLPPSITAFTNNGLARGAVIYCYQYSYGHDFATSKGYMCEFLGVAPETVVAEGTFGDSITWQYTSHRKLKIDGTDGMPTDIAIPWADYLKKVETVEMTGSINLIAPNAFKNSLIKSITIPSSVMGIAYNAFYNNNYLTEITIPDTVVLIGDDAFYSCDSLEKITLPSYLITANFAMVGECNNLKTVCGRDDTFAERLAQNLGIEFVSTGEAPNPLGLRADITDTVYYVVDNLGDMTVLGEGEIPDYPQYESYITDNVDRLIVSGAVTKIGAYAFSGLKGVKAIELEEGVTQIGESAFRYTGVKEMRLPSTVTTLGAFAFADCDEMEYMWLNDNIDTIPQGLFRYCQSLKAVEVPTSVTSIEADVFEYATQPIYLHYAGSQKQWDAITLAENLPENVNVVYNSILPEEVKIEDISVRKSTTKVTVNLYPQLKGGEAAYIAGYSADGILIDLVPINPATETYTLDRKVEVVKVFVWNSTEDFIPLVEVYKKEF